MTVTTFRAMLTQLTAAIIHILLLILNLQNFSFILKNRLLNGGFFALASITYNAYSEILHTYSHVSKIGK